ncbi:hypothetical protein [Cognatilysobacter bugurensis]|uniref:Molybdopterin molybdenumtransferase n=1 Tax=Cognatilysobacter bugurensis TaxID=543356 RepID=A0A918W5H6_9GAMM|nr:hypothetical protein [Lysobacter bugurensis]GHA74145.1 hypothetical protein GCM10007067_08820 [Lysobacter bugurensis]
MNLTDALETVRRVGAVRTTDVQTLALARAHRRVLAEEMLGPDASPVDVAAPGQVLTPIAVAHAARVGVEIARVRRRPTIAVFVIESGDRGASDAAHALLTGLLRADGLEPTAWPSLQADERNVEIAIRDAGCAFDAIAVCGDTNGRALVDRVLAAFGDVRVAALDLDGEAAAFRFATLDAACVLALPLDPLALAGLYLTAGRALIDALEARTDRRLPQRARLDAPRATPRAFEWARARVDEPGVSTLVSTGMEVSAGAPVDAVLLPESEGAAGDASSLAVPLPTL